MKKPAAVQNAAKVEKESAAAVQNAPKVKFKVKKESTAVQKAPKPPKFAADGENPSVSHFKGGCLYVVVDAQKVRALKEAGNVKSEVSRMWGHNRTYEQAWHECCSAIAQHKIIKKRKHV